MPLIYPNQLIFFRFAHAQCKNWGAHAKWVVRTQRKLGIKNVFGVGFKVGYELYAYELGKFKQKKISNGPANAEILLFTKNGPLRTPKQWKS